MADLDYLFDTASGPWRDRITDDQREWLGTIADRMNETGQNPAWRRVWQAWKEKYPGTKVPGETSIAKLLRELADERG